MQYIDYNAFNQTIAQLKTINHFSMYCVFPTFWPAHGHCQGHLQQRNITVADSVTDVHM